MAIPPGSSAVSSSSSSAAAAAAAAAADVALPGWEANEDDDDDDGNGNGNGNDDRRLGGMMMMLSNTTTTTTTKDRTDRYDTITTTNDNNDDMDEMGRRQRSKREGGREGEEEAEKEEEEEEEFDGRSSSSLLLLATSSSVEESVSNEFSSSGSLWPSEEGLFLEDAALTELPDLYPSGSDALYDDYGSANHHHHDHGHYDHHYHQDTTPEYDEGRRSSGTGSADHGLVHTMSGMQLTSSSPWNEPSESVSPIAAATFDSSQTMASPPPDEEGDGLSKPLSVKSRRSQYSAPKTHLARSEMSLMGSAPNASERVGKKKGVVRGRSSGSDSFEKEISQTRIGRRTFSKTEATSSPISSSFDLGSGTGSGVVVGGGAEAGILSSSSSNSSFLSSSLSGEDDNHFRTLDESAASSHTSSASNLFSRLFQPRKVFRQRSHSNPDLPTYFNANSFNFEFGTAAFSAAATAAATASSASASSSTSSTAAAAAASSYASSYAAAASSAVAGVNFTFADSNKLYSVNIPDRHVAESQSQGQNGVIDHAYADFSGASFALEDDLVGTARYDGRGSTELDTPEPEVSVRISPPSAFESDADQQGYAAAETSSQPPLTRKPDSGIGTAIRELAAALEAPDATAAQNDPQPPPQAGNVLLVPPGTTFLPMGVGTQAAMYGPAAVATGATNMASPTSPVVSTEPMVMIQVPASALLPTLQYVSATSPAPQAAAEEGERKKPMHRQRSNSLPQDNLFYYTAPSSRLYDSVATRNQGHLIYGTPFMASSTPPYGNMPPGMCFQAPLTPQAVQAFYAMNGAQSMFQYGTAATATTATTSTAATAPTSTAATNAASVPQQQRQLLPKPFLGPPPQPPGKKYTFVMETGAHEKKRK